MDLGQHVKGHRITRVQLALLAFVHTLLPAGDAVTLVGESGLGSVAVLRQLDKWHWFYFLRQKANTGVWLNEQSGWKVFGVPYHSLWLTTSGRSHGAPRFVHLPNWLTFR